MILSKLEDADRYISLHPLIARALEHLRTTDLHALAPGKYTVQGDELFMIVKASPGKKREEAKLECHRRYIDIQLVIEGVDEMGWRPLEECKNPVSEFDLERDIQFFEDMPSSWVATPAGSFCMFFPDDAHAPLVSDGMIRKVLMKIAV